MLSEGKVGLVVGADGALNPLRLDKTSALVTANGHSFYGEAAQRGTMFSASTPVAGLAPGTVLAVAATFGLWNPPSSGKNLVVLKASLGYVSGTLGGGSMVYARVTQTTVPTTGTALTAVACRIGDVAGVGLAYSGSTFAAVPTIIRPAFILGAFLATTALMPQLAVDLVDGEFVIQQGNALIVHGVAAAGTTPLVMVGMTWEEVPA